MNPPRIPEHLWDNVCPASTTVVGDIDAFFNQYVGSGQCFREWQLLAALAGVQIRDETRVREKLHGHSIPNIPVGV